MLLVKPSMFGKLEVHRGGDDLSFVVKCSQFASVDLWSGARNSRARALDWLIGNQPSHLCFLLLFNVDFQSAQINKIHFKNICANK